MLRFLQQNLINLDSHLGETHTEHHLNSETSYYSNTANFPFSPNTMENVFSLLYLDHTWRFTFLREKRKKREKRESLSMNCSFHIYKHKLPLDHLFKETHLFSTIFNNWDESLFYKRLSSLIYSYCKQWETAAILESNSYKNFLSRDFMCQPLPRDRLPAMENHSRSVIPSTYSQKHSAATTLHKREGNGKWERRHLSVRAQTHEAEWSIVGWHKIHVHTHHKGAYREWRRKKIKKEKHLGEQWPASTRQTALKNTIQLPRTLWGA